MKHDRPPLQANGIGILFGAGLFAYMEYIHHFASPESMDTHVWILLILALVGVLAWAAVAGARPRS